MQPLGCNCITSALISSRHCAIGGLKSKRAVRQAEKAGARLNFKLCPLTSSPHAPTLSSFCPQSSSPSLSFLATTVSSSTLLHSLSSPPHCSASALSQGPQSIEPWTENSEILSQNKHVLLLSDLVPILSQHQNAD